MTESDDEALGFEQWRHSRPSYHTPEPLCGGNAFEIEEQIRLGDTRRFCEWGGLAGPVSSLKATKDYYEWEIGAEVVQIPVADFGEHDELIIAAAERMLEDPLLNASGSMTYGDRPLTNIEMYAMHRAFLDGFAACVARFIKSVLNYGKDENDGTIDGNAEGHVEEGGLGHPLA